jgi:hypothetical protein
MQLAKFLGEKVTENLLKTIFLINAFSPNPPRYSNTNLAHYS